MVQSPCLADREEVLRRRVVELEQELAAARRNLAIEKLPALREAVREEYRRSNGELETARKQRDVVKRNKPNDADKSPEQEIKAALGLLDEIRHVAEDEKARAAIPPILDRLGFRIGLSFVEATKGEKRRVRRLAGGLIAFGDALRPGDLAPPCGGDNDDQSSGRDDCSQRQNRNRVRKQDEATPADHSRSAEAAHSEKCHGEGTSFTKGSRGDKTAIELFLAGIRGWETGLRRKLNDDQPRQN